MKSISKTDKQVQKFENSSGARIFKIPLEIFPGFWGHAYLVLIQDYRVLIDVGSGFGNSNAHLESGLAIVNQEFQESFELSDLTHILITHGHIDHFGGLSYVKEHTSAQIGIHELDVRNITNYEERLTVVAHHLDDFLIEAGVPEAHRNELIELYKLTKLSYHSVPVDITFHGNRMNLGPFEVIHVPGHCAGHVVVRLDDVLFSGDHVLGGISPHQAPESLTQYTGLGHYLESLESMRPWAGDIRLTLGGHNAPISDLPGRLDEIKFLHEERLERVLDLLVEPRTIREISKHLFGEVRNYNVLLALEEAGSHIEYLYQRGYLSITNLTEYESHNGSVPIMYHRL